MIKTILRTLAIASVVFVASVAFVTAPVSAADGLKMSRSVQKVMVEAKKLIDAKDWTNAAAKLKEAKAITDQNDYDRYMISTFLGVALFQSGDKAGATDAFIAAASVPNMPENEHKDSVHKAMMMIIDARDYAKLVEFAKVNLPDNTLTSTTASYIAISYYNLNDYTNALTYAHKSIGLSKAEGKTPDRDMYQLVLSSQSHTKDLKAQIKSVEDMCGLYGTPEDWSRLIDITLGTLPTGSKSNRGTVALFLYRLRLITKAETAADDYQLAADLAIDQNSPGDAVVAMRAAQAAGKTTAKTAATLSKAQKMAKSDEPTLVQAEAAAAKSANANLAVSVAEGYFGYQRYADAERVAEIAVAKNGAKQNEALMVLGAAQVMQGKKPEAAATFAKVKGDASFERIADVWTVYATRTYDVPKPAPAAAPAN